MASQTFKSDGPLLVVASGRDTIPVASAIKQLAPGNVFLVQIQHPRSHLNRFDLVITPCHDYYPLTPHGQRQIPWFLRSWITPENHLEKMWFSPSEPFTRLILLHVRVLHLPGMLSWHPFRNLCLWLILEALQNCSYGVDLAKQLAAMLQNVLWSCGSLKISFSRRTPEKVSKILMREFSMNPKVYIWDGEGRNPHLGHLAWADAFVITADSVSMLSEACSIGKPVYVSGAEHCTWKFADFQNSLQERGVVRPFTGKDDMSECWSYSPLNDTVEAARQVKMALAERGWSILGKNCLPVLDR